MGNYWGQKQKKNDRKTKSTPCYTIASIKLYSAESNRNAKGGHCASSKQYRMREVAGSNPVNCENFLLIIQAFSMIFNNFFKFSEFLKVFLDLFLNFLSDFRGEKIDIARGPKYMGKFRFVYAFRGDLIKNSNYRDFRITDVRIGEVPLQQALYSKTSLI